MTLSVMILGQASCPPHSSHQLILVFKSNHFLDLCSWSHTKCIWVVSLFLFLPRARRPWERGNPELLFSDPAVLDPWLTGQCLMERDQFVKCRPHFLFQEKMNRMRQRIAQRLKEAQNTCAMLTTFNEIDMRWELSVPYCPIAAVLDKLAWPLPSPGRGTDRELPPLCTAWYGVAHQTLLVDFPYAG